MKKQIKINFLNTIKMNISNPSKNAIIALVIILMFLMVFLKILNSRNLFCVKMRFFVLFLLFFVFFMLFFAFFWEFYEFLEFFYDFFAFFYDFLEFFLCFLGVLSFGLLFLMFCGSFGLVFYC